jgi:predicted DNA-binding transcriptional regulator AlpA
MEILFISWSVNMAQKVLSNRQSSDVAKQPWRYLETRDDGRFLLEHQDGKAFVSGTIYRLYLIPQCNPTEKARWRRKLISTTPNYQESKAHDQSFIAYSKDGNRRYRVTGKVKFLRDKQSGHSSVSISKSSDKETLASADFRVALKSIAAQRDAGLDPDVRMSFIAHYLGESRANLYRKMGTTFPRPCKRGRGSYWSLSLIDAYKSGTWNPTGN